MQKMQKQLSGSEVRERLDEYPEGVETMLTVHLRWLNLHHERNDEELMRTDDGSGGLAHYFMIWEAEGKDKAGKKQSFTTEDVPKLLHDSGWLQGGPYVRRRVLMVSATPYHDEGGPAVLTAFFEADDSEVAETEGGWDSVHGQMRMLIQEFDTEYQEIWQWGRDSADRFMIEGEGPVPG